MKPDPMLEELFHVDWATADEDHLSIDVSGYGTVSISKSADGLAVDIYPFHVADGPVSSCYADLADLFGAPADDGSPPASSGEAHVLVLPVLGTCDVCQDYVFQHPWHGTYCSSGHSGAPYTPINHTPNKEE